MSRLLWILLFFTGMKLGAQDSLLVAMQVCEDQKKMGELCRLAVTQCAKDEDCYTPYFLFLGSKPASDIKLTGFHSFASALYGNGMLLSAREFNLKAISLAKEPEISQAVRGKLYNTMTLIYKDLNVLDSALYFAQATADEYAKYRPEEALWSPSYNRYLIYLQLNDYEQADFYLKKSYEYVKNSSSRMDKGFVLHSLCLAAKDRWKKEEFDYWLDEFIEFKKAGSPGKKLDLMHNGLLDFFEDKEEGIRHLEKKIAEFKKDSALVPDDLARLTLSYKYDQQGEMEKALAQLDTIIQDGPEYTQNLKTIRLAQYAIYKKAGDYKQAMTALEAYISLQDSSFNQLLDGKIAEYEAKYQMQLTENELMKKDLELKNIKLDKQKLLGGSGLILLTSFWTLLFYYRRARHQKILNIKQEELNEKRIQELEQQNKLLALSSMIEGQEAERYRIAQDLHDGLGGLLTSVKAHFNTIARELDAVSKINVYQKTNQLIDEACTEVRRIAHDMIPHSLAQQGLEGVISELEDTIHSAGMEAEIEVHYPLEKIPEQKATMIYRMLQEIVQNAIKHAKAKKMLIQFFGDDKNLHILAEDDGKGFDVNELILKKGMGLKSLESRVQYLEGKVDIDSKIGQGTTINLAIPVP